VGPRRQEPDPQDLPPRHITFRGSLGPTLTGYDEFAGYVDGVTGALGQYTTDILALMEEGNRVSGKMRFPGFHRKEMFSVPPAARAGYDLAGVENVWREMGQTHPDSIRWAKTHPTATARFIQMREVAAEIADKKRRHLPLVPDLKVAADAQPAPTDSNY
jgi:hypothetical protein